jgi:ubiquinone/menaquinone biosynthesis C-methylase UbiE
MQRRDPDGVERAVIASLVDFAGLRVLDVGCGGGRLTSLAAAHATEVYAFDPDGDSVAKAKSALSEEARRKVRFEVHSAEALDVPRRRFDLALCGWSL